MNGQWLGPYEGTNSGLVVADIDDARSHYQAVIFAYDTNNAHPRTFASFDLPKGKDRFHLRANLSAVERGSGNLLLPKDVAEKFPGVVVPTYADTDWVVDNDEMHITRKTDIGTNGQGTLKRSEASKPSRLTALPNVQSWFDFRSFILSVDAYRYAYRGHRDSTWRLRTSFHRSGRASLVKFSVQDVPALHRHLTGMTSHKFNMGEPTDYASFLNLTQHHGYPTPLLDWTHSPFVAAYFAFKDLRRDMIGPNKKVRILLFDAQTWNAKMERAPVLMPGHLHITILETLPIDNPRVLPQQSMSMVTNVDDIEPYVERIEQRDKASFLQAVDLPTDECRAVMQDLALMGITAGSLFPGLDGACQQLKERFFDL